MNELFPQADGIELIHLALSTICVICAIIVVSVAHGDKAEKPTDKGMQMSADAALERGTSMLVMQLFLHLAAVISVYMPPPNPGIFTDQASYFRVLVMCGQATGGFKSIREYYNRRRLWAHLKKSNKRSTDPK